MRKPIITTSKTGQKELAKFLIEHGFIQKVVAGIIGRHRNTIIEWAKRHKWKRKKSLDIPSEELVVIAYLREGYTKEAVARKLNITKSTVGNYAKKHSKLLTDRKPLLKRKIQFIGEVVRERVRCLIEKEKLNPRQAAIKENIPEKTIRKWIKKYSWKIYNKEAFIMRDKQSNS